MSEGSSRAKLLAEAPVGGLIRKFAVPAVIGMLVGALYNIVDQVFIGQSVGLMGNAATNVAFPLSTISTAIALLLGVGGASNFSLMLGRGERDKAARIVGTAVSGLVLLGVALAAVVLLFLEPMMRFFGATEQVLPYALEYARITAFGLPLLILGIGGGHLVRADGSPRYAMLATLSGAVLNVGLDALFILGFQMGMAGAALATVIGQALSAVLMVRYFVRFKTVKLTYPMLRPDGNCVVRIISLGAASCFNQLAMTVVQIVLNNTLTTYGAQSLYGSDIPLACAGVISKVNVIMMAFMIGIAQGCQPIVGFNYGAGNFARVRQTYRKAAVAALLIATSAFLCFQLFPRQIVSVFGRGSEAYFVFAERYFRIYLMMTAVNGIQPLTSNFFTSIGKAQMGVLMSLTRQILLLLPLLVLFPMIWGIDGVMYAGPIADGGAFVLSVAFMARELRAMKRLEMERSA